jgi:D-alanine-D-alanine ligase-like ATP-grasp enzyme
MRAWISACALYVLEANANPNISMAEDFAQSAKSVGIAYDELQARLLSLGLGYQAAWRLYEA